MLSNAGNYNNNNLSCTIKILLQCKDVTFASYNTILTHPEVPILPFQSSSEQECCVLRKILLPCLRHHHFVVSVEKSKSNPKLKDTCRQVYRIQQITLTALIIDCEKKRES